MNKDRVLVFPYDLQFTPLLRQKSFVDRYASIRLCSLPGWGLCERDAGYADGGEPLNLEVEQDFEGVLGEVDAVIFADADNRYHFEEMIYPKILAAIAAKKKIVTLLPLGEKLEEIRIKCDENEVMFRSYVHGPEQEPVADYIAQMRQEERKDIMDSRTPILAVIGLAEHTGKFQLQLALKASFEKLGYKISVIGSRSYCEFLGFHSFPSFMKSAMSETDKVLCFNRYIKEIEAKEQPDLIMVAVPGGFMRYNNKIINDFGITAYEVFQAVVPDAVVLSLFHEKYNADFINELLQSTKYKLGLEVDALHLSNRQIDWVEMTNSKPDCISTLTINPEYLKKTVEECSAQSPIPVINLMEEGDEERLAGLIVDKLSEAEMAVQF
ncbi:TIGR04066 family peptide maturation system protein [Paenibacillus glufosinatiresistens]|uniref:TIGR04066 family peptide maturation system protein n=1 Tax=Paenibacillus glufosinatiresistens TaxID=3070657 RepID=UPI00286DD287|nr:TIGR04066 family peptide maturation system protein [Paenibacillus sp. YX.27]